MFGRQLAVGVQLIEQWFALVFRQDDDPSAKIFAASTTPMFWPFSTMGANHRVHDFRVMGQLLRNLA
ncbi:hypothetical protein AWU82_29820 [Pseudomonas glycinae]|uniref:Uncharacterized protein n=1 Tax=Pseudomonas glycinae TaxID=1785145 RepID=A0ABM6QI38_9PSED|nr:hypothetical protein AWU82_29820 [Pseudomonas glycinae]